MASLSDVPIVIRRVGLWRFSIRVWDEVADDHLFTWAAALAYSWLFAVFPFLIFLLTLVPYLPKDMVGQASVKIEEAVYTYLGDYSGWYVWENIKGVLDRPRGGLLSLGLIITIWAASGGINTTMTALDRCYEIEHGRSFFKQRFLAILITLVVATMILAVLVLIPIGTIVTDKVLDYWKQQNWYFPQWILWTWQIARYSLATVLLFTVVSVMYHFGVSVKQKWRVFTPGGLFSIAVWFLLGLVFRWYVNQFGKESYDKTYGTVGGIAVMLLFFYTDALVFMIGAEINSEIDYEILGVPRGSRDLRRPVPPMFSQMSLPMAPPAGPERTPASEATDKSDSQG